MKTSYMVMLVLGGVAAGYVISKYEQSLKGKVPPDAPLPPLPVPPSPEESIVQPELPASYAEEWDEALSRYSIDFWPPEAEPHLDRLLPPPEPSGISVGVGCKVVAVGEDWWELAGHHAQRYVDQGLQQAAVVRETLRFMAPSCLSNNTAAANGLRKELSDWIAEMEVSPQRNGET